MDEVSHFVIFADSYRPAVTCIIRQESEHAKINTTSKQVWQLTIDAVCNTAVASAEKQYRIFEPTVKTAAVGNLRGIKCKPIALCMHLCDTAVAAAAAHALLINSPLRTPVTPYLRHQSDLLAEQSIHPPYLHSSCGGHISSTLISNPPMACRIISMLRKLMK